jgi:hypothetical protein
LIKANLTAEGATHSGRRDKVQNVKELKFIAFLHGLDHHKNKQVGQTKKQD